MNGVGVDEMRVAATELMRTIVERCDKEPSQVKRAKSNAIYEVCRQWLVEHPEDDYEPVTEEWLRNSVGWIPVEGSGYIGRDRIIFCKGSESVYSAWLQISQYYYDMRRIVRVETRGDVRRLCKALGISLVG